MDAEGTSAARLRILVVENDRADQRLLTQLLTALGQDVSPVSNSSQALCFAGIRSVRSDVGGLFISGLRPCSLGKSIAGDRRP